ncbi:MAG TPA: 50S ribosomal protein L30 [Bacteroidota bacterium]|nr:50S ribosomal protein L30 [Bacteroidota bacterium]
MAKEKQIRITQTRSIIDELENAKRTIKALGLGRPNYVVIKKDTPQIRGMVNAVRHLVSVEEVK